MNGGCDSESFEASLRDWEAGSKFGHGRDKIIGSSGKAPLEVASLGSTGTGCFVDHFEKDPAS